MQPCYPYRQIWNHCCLMLLITVNLAIIPPICRKVYIMTHQESRFHASASRLVILIAGDLLVLLSFVLIGRRNHALSATDIVGALYTAVPFVISWFLVTPWVGIYRADVSQAASKLLPRLLLGWAIAVPLGHVLRALLLGRPIPAGIPLTFVLVSLGYIGLVMLAWRMGYLWWANRQQIKAMKEAEL